MGLSYGDVKKLYEALNNDAYRWEASSGSDIILWGTTETPSKGEFSNFDSQIIKSIRHIYFPEFSGKTNDHPFYLRGIGRYLFLAKVRPIVH